MFQINWYKSVTEPTVQGVISIDTWISLIRNPFFHERIRKARKPHRNKYAWFKRTQLPCVTFNFLYDGYKEDTNIIAATGFLYIDLDIIGFIIQNLDLKKIYAYYHSLSGKKYSLIVRVDGLTIHNFKSTYNFIMEELGLTGLYDPNAVKPSQFSVASYDPDAYLNENAHVFQAVEPSDEIKSILNSNSTPFVSSYRGWKENNIEEYHHLYDDKGYIKDLKEGFPYIECYKPFNKIKRNRNSILLSYCRNLVWLNPTRTPDEILEKMAEANCKICEYPVNKAQVERIVDSILKQHEGGKLTPKYWESPRRIIFNPGVGYSKVEKMSIWLRESGDNRLHVTLNKILSILQQWDYVNLGKISSRSIVSNFPINKKTLGRYYTYFLPSIEKRNQEFKMGEYGNSSTFDIDLQTMAATIISEYPEGKYEYREWTSYEVEQLALMVFQEKTPKEMAEALNRTVNSVKAKLKTRTFSDIEL